MCHAKINSKPGNQFIKLTFKISYFCKVKSHA